MFHQKQMRCLVFHKLKKKILCVTKLKGHIECGKITSMLLQYGKKKCAARKKIAKALLQYTLDKWDPG